jgi:hypothetical protein
LTPCAGRGKVNWGEVKTGPAGARVWNSSDAQKDWPLAAGGPAGARLIVVPELGSAVIVNPYAVLDAFLTLLRLLVGLFILLAGAAAWRRSFSAPTSEVRTAVEDRSYLLYSLALLLLALNLLSWPLLYLLLQS